MAIAQKGWGYSGFQVTGMIEWRQKSKPPKKSLGLPTKPIKISGPKISPPPRNPMFSFRALKISRKQKKLDCTLFAELRGWIRGHENFKTPKNPSIIPVT